MTAAKKPLPPKTERTELAWAAFCHPTRVFQDWTESKRVGVDLTEGIRLFKEVVEGEVVVAVEKRLKERPTLIPWHNVSAFEVKA